MESSPIHEIPENLEREERANKQAVLPKKWDEVDSIADENEEPLSPTDLQTTNIINHQNSLDRDELNNFAHQLAQPWNEPQEWLVQEDLQKTIIKESPEVHSLESSSITQDSKIETSELVDHERVEEHEEVASKPDSVGPPVDEVVKTVVIRPELSNDNEEEVLVLPDESRIITENEDDELVDEKTLDLNQQDLVMNDERESQSDDESIELDITSKDTLVQNPPLQGDVSSLEQREETLHTQSNEPVKETIESSQKIIEEENNEILKEDLLPNKIPKSSQPYPTAELTLKSPPEGSIYHSQVTVHGQSEGIQEIHWQCSELDSGGTVDVGENGSFDFDFYTFDYNGNVSLHVMGVDVEGKSHHAQLSLVNDGEGPALFLDSPLSGGMYNDSVEILGHVGPGSHDPEGIGEVASVSWKFAGEELRPVIFDSSGSFGFRVDMRQREGDVELVVVSSDHNGNVTHQSLLLEDGRLAPQMVLEGPSEGAYFGAGLRFHGSVFDPYSQNPFFEDAVEVRYEILPTDNQLRGAKLEGVLPLGRDGQFDQVISTQGLEGEQRLVLTVVGRNGKSITQTLLLQRGASDIPDFSLTPQNQSVWSEWSGVPEALGYAVLVKSDSGELRRFESPQAGITITGLENGHEYTMEVEAQTPYGLVKSHTERVLPLSPETLAPQITGEFRRIRLDWNPIPSSHSYVVYRATTPDGPFLPLDENVSGAQFIDTDVRFGQRYWYSVAPVAYANQKSQAVWGESLIAQRRSVERLARMEGFLPHSIRVEGDYAFMVSPEQGFAIVDVINPSRPRMVGSCALKGALDVAVLGEYAYVAAGEGGLKTISVSIPSRPQIVGSRRAGKSVSVQVKGNYAFLADQENGLRVLDVRDPLNPRRLYQSEGYRGEDLLVQGERAYLADPERGVVVFDLQNPLSPQHLGTYRSSEACCVSTFQNGAFLAVGHQKSGVKIYDLESSIGSAPIALIPGLSIEHIENAEDFLLLGTQDSLVLMNIRNPRDPYLFQTYAMNQVSSLSFQKDRLLVSYDDGFEVHQTYLVGSSYMVKECSTRGRSYGVSGYDQKLYVASHQGGVSIHHPQNLSLLQSVPSHFAEAVAPGLRGLYIADGSAGMRYCPNDSEVSVIFDGYGYARDVVSWESWAFGAVDQGILVLEEIPEGAQRKSFLPFNGCTALALTENGFLAAGKEVLELYAIAANGDAIKVHSLPIQAARDVAYSHGRVALLNAEGVDLYRITETKRIQKITSIDFPAAHAVTLDERYLYLSAGAEGLLMYDLKQFHQPWLVSQCPEVFAVDAWMNEQRLYVVDGENLYTVENSIPEWMQ
ncbi:MAG: hypothetical protein MI717_14180 [Spirochaetales bacterium]|nr:hypothetical protein [Spirochaetales bacterium]